MNEFRLTRRSIYGEGTHGEINLSARQGHYIRADYWQEAYAKMLEQYPGEVFDVQYWTGALPVKQGQPLVFWVS